MALCAITEKYLTITQAALPLYQTTWGLGAPVTSQASLTLSPAMAVWLLGILVISGDEPATMDMPHHTQCNNCA